MMTEAYIESLCFEYRVPDYSNITPLYMENLKYSIGTSVVLRSLAEILENPRVTSCTYENGMVILELDSDSECRFSINSWNTSRVITGYNEVDVKDFVIYYYTYSGGWLDEFMITTTNRKLKLLNSLKYFKEISNG